MAKSILLINGPNLNLLGTREPHLYGSATLDDVLEAANKQAKELDIDLQTFQSNHEGALIDRIQAARGKCQFAIVNPAVSPIPASLFGMRCWEWGCPSLRYM